MQFGPVQLVAFAFDSVDKFKGQIRRELDVLRGRGMIRVIDLLFILRKDDGSVHSLQASGLLDDAAAPEAIDTLVRAEPITAGLSAGHKRRRCRGRRARQDRSVA